MKILVTGGAGFIASHIVDEYVKAGHKVVIVDNLSFGSRKNLNPKAKFYKADIRNYAKMDAVFKKERPQIVNHHAAFIEVVRSIRDPISTFETNINGTVNVLLAAGKYKVKKFIFSSTGGAMYGSPKKLPVTESTPPSPLSPYGLSKEFDEICIRYYAQMYGFKYFIFRYANVYGPRQNPNGRTGAVAIFGGLMKSGRRPTIFGDGSKSRDYVYVDDVARANRLALTKGVNELAHIGSGKAVSDLGVFKTVAKYAHFKGNPIYASFRKGEVMRFFLSNTKAKKILGWAPRVTFDEGVKRTINAL